MVRYRDTHVPLYKEVKISSISEKYNLLIMYTTNNNCLGTALHADLSFDLSFDRVVLKNLDSLTLARNIPVSAEALPLLDIVVTAFHIGSQDLLLAFPL